LRDILAAEETVSAYADLSIVVALAANEIGYEGIRHLDIARVASSGRRIVHGANADTVSRDGFRRYAGILRGLCEDTSLNNVLEALYLYKASMAFAPESGNFPRAQADLARSARTVLARVALESRDDDWQVVWELVSPAGGSSGDHRGELQCFVADGSNWFGS